MPPIRYAIWAAVSTERQAAADKTSLAEQQRKCRAIAASRGWRETAGPYVVPGATRTGWVNLRDAENAIPQLRQMLIDAQNNAYDLLLIYDYNRLRDLANPVAKTLAVYGVQLYSANQPVQPLPPEKFNPYANDSEFMMRGLNDIVQQWQVSDLLRKYRYGVTRRVLNGLPALNLPRGYKKPPGRETDPSAVPVINPLIAPAIIRMKNDYLAGYPHSEIAQRYNAATASQPPLGRASVPRILVNPFYAGRVTFGRERIHRDPRNNKTIRAKNENYLIANGKHQPLWDWDTHLLILAEQKRRGGKNPRRRYRNLSGLIRCAVCQKRAWYRQKYIRCDPRNGNADHIALPVAKADLIIPPAIAAALRAYNPDAPPAPAAQTTDQRLIAELNARKTRIQNGYENGIYDTNTASQRIKTIDAKIQRIRADQKNENIRAAMRAQFNAAVAEITPMLEILPNWINAAPPLEVNRILRRLIDDIIITPEHKIQIKFRN